MVPSDHANQRASQRNFRQGEVEFIVKYGEELHNAGVIFCQLRDKDFPSDYPGNHPFRRLIGATVVLTKSGDVVMTLYKNPKAFKKNRKKAKYNRVSQYDKYMQDSSRHDPYSA